MKYSYKPLSEKEFQERFSTKKFSWKDPGSWPIKIWAMFLFLPCIFILISGYYAFYPSKNKKSTSEEIKLYYEKTIKEQSAKLTEEKSRQEEKFFLEPEVFPFFYDDTEKRLYFSFFQFPEIFSIEIYSSSLDSEKSKRKFKNIGTVEKHPGTFGWFYIPIHISDSEELYILQKPVKINPQQKQDLLKKYPKEYAASFEKKDEK